MTTYRAAVAGCGVAGSLVDAGGTCPLPQSHAGLYTAHPRFDLVAGCDPDDTRREAFQRTWKPGRVHRDLDEMLAVEKPDVLSLATPTNLHVQGLESALAAGVPVVVLEKPVSWAESDLADLLPSLVRTATKIVVAYQRRWSGNFIKLDEYLQRGGIGEVVKVHVNYPMGLIHGGTHALDLLHWYFGPCSEARSLTVLAEPVRDAVLDCQFEWPGGLRASFQGFAREPWNLFEMDFFGTKGRVRAGCGGRTMEFFAAAPDPDYPRLTALAPVDEPFASDWQGAYVNLGDHLVDLLERPEARPRCSLDDGLFALRAAAAALRSAVSGGARTPI